MMTETRKLTVPEQTYRYLVGLQEGWTIVIEGMAFRPAGGKQGQQSSVDSVRTVSWSGEYGRPTASTTGVPAPYRKMSHASEAGPLLSGIYLKMHKGIITSPLSLS